MEKNVKLDVIAEAIFEKDRIFKQNEGIIMPIWNELPSVDKSYYYEMAENVINRMKEKLSGIGYSTSNPEESKKFEQAVIPVIKYLNENCHPHCCLVIGHTRAELLEGKESIVITEFLKD